MKMAKENFGMEMEKALLHLEEIKNAINKLESNFKSDENNWGYVGSITHINELLGEIINFSK